MYDSIAVAPNPALQTDDRALVRPLRSLYFIRSQLNANVNLAFMNNPHTDRFERKLDRIGRFAKISEQQLSSMSAELDARLDARSRSYPESSRQDFFEANLDESIELSDALPTILRYAVLTGADTALEVYLNETCGTFTDVHSPHVHLGDLKGNGIERARAYLKKVALLPFPDQSQTWIDLTRLHDLRNCVVHADGRVPDNHAALREWCLRSKYASLSSFDVVALHAGFTEFALSAYAEFAKGFDAACKEHDLWKNEFPPIDIEEL